MYFMFGCKPYWLTILFSAPIFIYAQSDTLQQQTLSSVFIKAYELNQRLKDIPATINYIGKNTLERFSNASIVAAVNSTPGVRMEERSPGSFRFNIRGSSLRSPFGVRNVKVYFNDIPITDPGGLTYINQLGYYNFRSLEIIKGPGSSLYGAGTGGVLIIESMADEMVDGALLEYATGSYGLHNIYGSITTGSPTAVVQAGFQHQQYDGYRVHSNLRRDVFTLSGRFKAGKGDVKATCMYGDLYYQTPGALTSAEYLADPRAARPGNILFPGAEVAGASINQKQFITGISYEQALLKNIKNRTVVYGMFTDLKNPAIQNYGHSSEPHTGGRTVFAYTKQLNDAKIDLRFGGEAQKGFTRVNIHKNVNGNADSLRTHDEINNLQSLIFTQFSVNSRGWIFTAGGSLNFLNIKFERFSPATSGKQQRRFTNQFAPRIAIMKKLGDVNIYSSLARGFSPPTTSELIPTGGAVNLDLRAESGLNYDVGVKGIIEHFYFDINAFSFGLHNTIVQRRTAGGGDYYVNAGKTEQYGIETYLHYPLAGVKPGYMKRMAWLSDKSIIWLSHTWHNFHYRDFIQLTNDYSGNKLPSVAPQVLSAGIDIQAKSGLILSLNYFYSGKIPLNDANTDFARSYHLIGGKVGIERTVEQTRIKVVAGVENLLNEKYSLGNDINGFGGRYYNAAPGRNYYAAVGFQFIKRRNN